MSDALKSGSTLDPSTAAKALVRRGLKTALATLEPGSGNPYVSLVTVATSAEGAPLLLISGLAVHTKNITADPRVSLLFDGTDLHGDPLAGGRVTVSGNARITTDANHKRRFLARHPEAEGYASFADFAFYEIQVERAHFIGGFGRIVSLSASQMLTDTKTATALLNAEADIVQHMNDDHADAIQMYAIRLAKEPHGAWRMTSLDPEGLDVVDNGGRTARILFTNAVQTPNEARLALVELSTRARSMS